MATMATRSGRGLLALIFVAMACISVVPNFSMLGSVPPSGPPAEAFILHKLGEVQMRLDAGEYDQKVLREDIQILEDMVQDSMEVATTTQIEWLENTLQTVATLKKRLARQRGLPATFLAVGVLAFFLAGAAALNINNTRNMTAPRNIQSRLWSSDTTKTSALHRFRRGEEFKLFTQKEQQSIMPFAFFEDTNKRNMTAPRNIQSRLLSSSTTWSSTRPRRGEELKLVAQHQQTNTHENTSNDA